VHCCTYAMYGFTFSRWKILKQLYFLAEGIWKVYIFRHLFVCFQTSVYTLGEFRKNRNNSTVLQYCYSLILQLIPYSRACAQYSDVLYKVSCWRKSYPNKATLFLDWRNRYKNSTVIITNWLIVTKYLQQFYGRYH
jgi:hypothetical protein